MLAVSPFKQLTPPASFSMRNDQEPSLPVLAYVKIGRCNGSISKVFELKSQVRCWLPWVLVFFWCFKDDTINKYIYIYDIFIYREGYILDASIFFSRYYPRHNVTFNFPGSLSKVFWSIIFCILDSSIVLNIFRNINSINQVSGTNQVEGSEHPHKRKVICSSSWALFCWQGQLMIFLRMLREASVCCRDVWMSFLKRGLKANTQFGRVSPCLQTLLLGMSTDAKKMCLTAWLK